MTRMRTFCYKSKWARVYKRQVVLGASKGLSMGKEQPEVDQRSTARSSGEVRTRVCALPSWGHRTVLASLTSRQPHAAIDRRKSSMARWLIWSELTVRLQYDLGVSNALWASCREPRLGGELHNDRPQTKPT